MSQLPLFVDATSRSDSTRALGAFTSPVSEKSGADAGPALVQSRITEAALTVRPSAPEFLQWGRWSADAPPRAEIQRRADLLHARFLEHSTRPVVLHLQVSGARTRWFIMKFASDRITLRVHWWLLQWPGFVGRMAVQTWLNGKLPPEFESWIAQRAMEFPGAAKTRNDLRAQGSRFHLGERLAAVSQLLDDPERRSEIHVGWGRGRTTPGRPSSLRLGCMNTRTRTMLIHPVLDQPGVPLYVVDMVVWHELCHWICPPLPSGQPNRIHHAEFHQLERRFAALDRADQWITRNFQWLARNA